MAYVFVEVNERGNRNRKNPVQKEEKPKGSLNDCSHLSDEEWQERLNKRSARLKAHGSHSRSRLIDKLEIPKPCREVLHWIDKYTRRSGGWKGARPSVGSGIRETGLSRKRFYECLQSLKHNGLVEVVSGQRAKQTNEYRIIEDALPGFAPKAGGKFVYAAYSRGSNQQFFSLYNEFLRITCDTFPGKTQREILTYLIDKISSAKVDESDSHFGGEASPPPSSGLRSNKGPSLEGSEGVGTDVFKMVLDNPIEKSEAGAEDQKSPLPPFNAVQPTQSINCGGSFVETPKILDSERRGLKVPAQLPVAIQAACESAGGVAMAMGAKQFFMPDARKIEKGEPAKAVARFKLPNGEFEFEFCDVSNQASLMQAVFTATLSGFGLLDKAPAAFPLSESILGQVPLASAASKDPGLEAKAEPNVDSIVQQEEKREKIAVNNAPLPEKIYTKTQRRSLSEVTSSERYVTRVARMEELLFSKRKQTQRSTEKKSAAEVKKLSPKDRASYYRRQKYLKDKAVKTAQKEQREKLEASRFYVFHQFILACTEFKRDPITQEMQPQDKRWIDSFLNRVKNDPESVRSIMRHAVQHWDLYRAEDKKLFSEPDFNQILAEWRIKRFMQDMDDPEAFLDKVSKASDEDSESKSRKAIWKKKFFPDSNDDEEIGEAERNKAVLKKFFPDADDDEEVSEAERSKAVLKGFF